ncbi:exosortase family protein XrtF [Sungkyunkwania multivorans]|uniref:Exosortase family protein XrtF n=1 Tax=Sungkyunkwania multivorans TaxID=1173618 RepID=A0ABW3D3U6_9FLAO
MLQLFKKYKAAIGFIVKFFVVYAILTFVYNQYLDAFDDQPDTLTVAVAKQSNALINLFGFHGAVEAHESEPTMKLIVNEKYVGRILEGCNSVSVLILFATFVLAFTGRWKRSVLFLLLGGSLIYSANLIRIAVIAIGLYKFPEKEYLLHQIIFPSMIYGMVFLLWMLWVNKFSKL